MTGREGSTDLVTLSGVPFVAPETKWETGEMETGGIPPFRGFVRLFRHFQHVFSPRGLVKSFLFLRQASGRHEMQSRQTERRVKRLKRVEACQWQSFMYSSSIWLNPCTVIMQYMLLYRQVNVYTIVQMYCTLGLINSLFWDMLLHGQLYEREWSYQVGQ